MKKTTAIVLTAFGTSTEARGTYTFFEEQARRQFPDHDVLWAYTSRTLRAKMAREGEVWLSPEELLRELPARGYSAAAIQSLHVVPGIEFEKITAAAAHAPLPTAVGAPLLSCSADCGAVLDALARDIGDPSACITVLAGHGTPHHGAQSLYGEFSRLLSARYPENVHVCMVEGDPSWEDALVRIRRSSCRRVRLVPFMFVAGDHIVNDVLGDDDSWASQLDGYAVEGSRRGLGLNRAIDEIYFLHLQEALNRL